MKRQLKIKLISISHHCCWQLPTAQCPTQRAFQPTHLQTPSAVALVLRRCPHATAAAWQNNQQGIPTSLWTMAFGNPASRPWVERNPDRFEKETILPARWLLSPREESGNQWKRTFCRECLELVYLNCSQMFQCPSLHFG